MSAALESGPDVTAFLDGGGETGDLIRRMDWSATPLGPVESWPQSLKTAVSLILRSPVPIVMLWGPDGIMLYNDAYSVFAGGRHPDLLGSKVREGWPEVADFNDNVMRVGLAGGTLAYRDQELTLFRHGRPEQVWMNLDYSPVLDESGKPAGVIAIVVETTQRVLAERHNLAERDRLRQMFEQAPGFMALLRGPDHVFELVNPTYLQLIGHRDVIGKPMRDALPDVASQGFADVLDQVLASGEATVGSATPVEVRPEPGGPAKKLYVDFVMQPLTDSTGDVTGVFIQGSDVTERSKAEALRAAQNRMMELAMRDAPLRQLLDLLLLTVEGQSESGMLASILLMEDDGVHMRHGSAPSLPEGYGKAIDGIEIGPNVGSCGTAAHRGKPVYVSDIERDPLWADFKELALEHGLRACWSTPIFSVFGEVLGTFAMYYREPREANPADLELVDFVTRSAAMVIERQRTAEALRERREEFLVLADNMPNLCWMAYADGSIFWYNRRWYDYTGTSPEDQAGWGWASVHDPEQLPIVLERWKKSIATGEPFEMTFPLRGADGVFRPFLTRVVPIRDESGRIYRWFGTNVDISDIARVEHELAEALEAKEILLHEVNHRVKNSLQVVTSLLMLQAGRTTDPELKQSLLEARGRISVVAAMHQRLYSTSQHDRVDFGDYLVELAQEALISLDRGDLITLRSDVERNVVLPLTEAVPLALVVSELITNVIKYAFPGGRGGELRVRLARSDEGLALCVEDNGVGLPDGFDPANSNGLGMRIVMALVRQIRGQLNVRTDGPGAAFEIVLRGDGTGDAGRPAR